MKIFLFLILLLLSCKTIQDSKPIENPEDKALIKKCIVTPDSGLNLRDAPSRKAKSIRLLPRGTMVSHKQVPENEKPDTIEDQKGKWLKVEVGNESGWLFDIYLSEPVFSPSGDKFYFFTIKHPKSKKIVKNGYCRGAEYENLEIEYICEYEFRNSKNMKIIDTTISYKGLYGWYDDENILTYSAIGDGGGGSVHVHSININTSVERNVYEESSQSYIHTVGRVSKEYVAWHRTCIFEKCLELSRGVNKVYVWFYSKKLNEKVEDKKKTLVKEFKINIYQNFWIETLSNEQILKLKNPYTGNIEFSVDKRNYLLHFPTGKITEVKDK